MKKFITVILSFIMIGLLFAATALLIFKDITRANTLEKVVKEIASNNTKDFMTELLDDMEGNEEFEESTKYFNNDEFIDALSEYLATGLEYASTGKGKAPDSSKLEEVVIDAAKKYEKETGNEVDIQEIRDSFDELDDSFDEFEKDFITDESAREVLKIAYGAAYLVPLALIAICLLIIYLMFKDIKPVLLSSSVVLIFVGIFTGVISIIIKEAIKIEPLLEGFGNIFGSIITKYALIYLITAIILLVIRFILKRKAKEAPAE